MSPSLKKERRICLILLILAGVYWLLFALPNFRAADNLQMVMAFEPDEAVPLPYVFDMIKPADSLKTALLNFAFYDYYFYGYPHFAYSAALLIPLALNGSLGNTQLVMGILRQMVSVLPMIAAILVVVFLQTGFRSYKAPLLFLFLANIPALVSNNYWWHPDSLAIFFAMLVLLFLARDNLRLGRFYYLAAAACGVSAGIKGIGFYFVLAVPVYLLLALAGKKVSLLRAGLSAGGYVLMMGAAYWLVNPILIYPAVRLRYFNVMREQSALLSEGYEVKYQNGLLASLPLFNSAFGGPALALLSFAACAWNSWRGSRRLVNGLILAWALPLTVLVLFFIHFKTQYWLPVALPLYSGLAAFLPEGRWQFPADLKGRLIRLGQMLAVLCLGVQAIFFLVGNVRGAVHMYYRVEESSAMQFNTASREALAPLPEDRPYHVYCDVNLYVDGVENWNKESRFEMLNDAYIQGGNFDILLLSQQRIYDYLNPLVSGVDAQQLEESRKFYRAANEGNLAGYRLAFRNDFGLVYLKQNLYDRYFQP